MTASRLMAAGLAVLALAAGCAAGSSGPPGQRTTPAQRRTPVPASVPVGRGLASRAHAGRAGLAAVLVAQASARVVYVLGRPAGAAGPGPVRLFRSDDGAIRFRTVATPAARSPVTGRPLTVSGLWFTGPADGYALFGAWGRRGPLMATSDGARTWHRVTVGTAGFIAAVAGHGRLAYALVVRCNRGLANCPRTLLYRAAAGSTTWTPVPAAGLAQPNASGGPSLAAWGRSVWIMAGNGEAPSPVLLASADAGRSFRRTTVPAIGCWLAATSPAVAWLTCSTGMMLTFDRSAGGRLARLPVTGAGTGNTVLAPVSGTAAYFGTGTGAAAGRLYLSRDGGAAFTRSGRLPASFRSATAAHLMFLTIRSGLSWTDGGLLMRTSDRGATWTTVRL